MRGALSSGINFRERPTQPRRGCSQIQQNMVGQRNSVICISRISAPTACLASMKNGMYHMKRRQFMESFHPFLFLVMWKRGIHSVSMVFRMKICLSILWAVFWVISYIVGQNWPVKLISGGNMALILTAQILQPIVKTQNICMLSN